MYNEYGDFTDELTWDGWVRTWKDNDDDWYEPEDRPEYHEMGS